MNDSVAEGFRFDFDEIWEIVTSVQVVRGNAVYRIEVVRNLKDANPKFSVHYFSRSDGVWRRGGDFGAVFADTAERALSQGLGFIRDASRA